MTIDNTNYHIGSHPQWVGFDYGSEYSNISVDAARRLAKRLNEAADATEKKQHPLPTEVKTGGEGWVNSSVALSEHYSSSVLLTVKRDGHVDTKSSAVLTSVEQARAVRDALNTAIEWMEKQER